jgi:23S rRNA (pseudouridine1915-N3)-methyltransferase
MRLIIAAIGRLKDGPDRELADRYIKRLEQAGRALKFTPIDVIELPEARGDNVDTRKADEASRLIAKLAGVEYVVAMDEHGRSLASPTFAELLAKKRDAGTGSLAFVIGGPDGHGPALLARADYKLTLSPMTLPHGLARIVLAEQLYRATTILSGHPYHRS